MKPCSTCGRSIHLLRNPSTDRWMPVDDEAAPDGNIRVDLQAKTATVLTGDALANARIAGEKLSLSHFVTCPQAFKHRRRT